MRKKESYLRNGPKRTSTTRRINQGSRRSTSSEKVKVSRDCGCRKNGR